MSSKPSERSSCFSLSQAFNVLSLYLHIKQFKLGEYFPPKLYHNAPNFKPYHSTHPAYQQTPSLSKCSSLPSSSLWPPASSAPRTMSSFPAKSSMTCACLEEFPVSRPQCRTAATSCGTSASTLPTVICPAAGPTSRNSAALLLCRGA